MARLVHASSADADYAEILTDLTTRAGWRVAAKFDELFEKLFEQLADHPRSGAPRPKLGDNIRIGIVLPYIIIYQHTEADDTVTVLRIVHGRRQITGRILRGRAEG